MAQQMFTKIEQQMLLKIGQQMFLKIGQQMFHTTETDCRQAGANQQMFLTYTIEIADGHTIEGRRPFVTPGRFFCLSFNWQLYHYLYLSNLITNCAILATVCTLPATVPGLIKKGGRY